MRISYAVATDKQVDLVHFPEIPILPRVGEYFTISNNEDELSGIVEYIEHNVHGYGQDIYIYLKEVE